MLRIPHENYIRFLITSGLDSVETNENLVSLGLSECDVEYWDHQYDELHKLKIPKKIKKFWKNPNPKFPTGFFEYMSVCDLKDAWLYNCGKNKEFNIAIDALHDEDMSIMLRALIGARIPVEEISALINGKFGIPFPKKAIEIFKKYFFNTPIMSRLSWKKYLGGLENEEKDILYLAISGQEIELRTELMLPNKISVSEHFQKLHVYAMGKFSQYSKAGDPKADANALKWAQMAMSSGKEYEKMKISDASDFGRDLQMEFDYVETEFATIGDSDLEEIKSAKEQSEKEENSAPIPINPEK